ncbi:MAG: ParB/RepB/Spo0J family partition protein, partial [Acidimicrobiales bacterium]
MYQDLSTDLVRPAADNLRRRTGDVSDIVASIKENPTLGIIEPLVVAPQEDGTYVIVAGARRHAAAVKAELATVPCIVRPMTEEERVLAMLIENDARHPLRITEQAAGYFRLVEAGWRIKDAAKATGRTAKHVAARLALLQLPAEIRAKVDDAEITVGDAALLLKLRHHPDILQEVASSVAEGEDNDVAWAVGQALAAIERQARRTAAMAELAAAGVAAVEHDGYGLPQGVAEIGAHRGLDVEAHAGEDCHVVVVGRDGNQRPGCVDPGRHAKKGASGLKVTRQNPAATDHDLAQRAEQKALRAAAATRAEYLRELLGRRQAKANVIGLV